MKCVLVTTMSLYYAPLCQVFTNRVTYRKVKVAQAGDKIVTFSTAAVRQMCGAI